MANYTNWLKWTMVTLLFLCHSLITLYYIFVCWRKSNHCFTIFYVIKSLFRPWVLSVFLDCESVSWQWRAVRADTVESSCYSLLTADSVDSVSEMWAVRRARTTPAVSAASDLDASFGQNCEQWTVIVSDWSSWPPAGHDQLKNVMITVADKDFFGHKYRDNTTWLALRELQPNRWF